ncbi:hypothetical protein SH139x_001371 [Planctomycetaceae bacterium SH139]
MSDQRPELDPFLTSVFKPLNPARDETDERLVFFEMGRAAGAAELGTNNSPPVSLTGRAPNRETLALRLQWLSAVAVIAVCSFVAGRMGATPATPNPSQNAFTRGTITRPSEMQISEARPTRDAIHPPVRRPIGESDFTDARNLASSPRRLSRLGLWLPARVRMPGEISLVASSGPIVADFLSTRSGNARPDREPLRPADALRFDGHWFGDAPVNDEPGASLPLRKAG